MTKSKIEDSTNEYEEIARRSRIKVLELIFAAQTSHIGSNLSCADIMAVLFEKMDLEEDRFVLSAGWKAAMLYYHLWRKGRINEEDLDSYCRDGSRFIGLAEPIIQDIPAAGGSMGYGLPFALAFAWDKKAKGEKGRIYVLMSDGEQAIGSTYEAARIATHHSLDNITVIVDRNGWQAMGKTEDILRIEPLRQFWEVMGWQAFEIDGHNFGEIESALNVACDRPVCIIARTVKGKGVKEFEDNNVFHYKAPSEREYRKALEELNV